MVFDCFTFFNELDLLELRFNILDPFVDKFILVESHQTFSGHPKPLYYAENKQRFAKWNDKIIHIIAPNIPVKEVLFERHWYAYELIEEELLNHDPEDIVFSSDLDEIWNPNILDRIKGENPDVIHTLSLFNYSYYLNMRSSEGWMDSLVAKNKLMFPGFTKTYRTIKQNILEEAGWHFTNCQGYDSIITKVAAYDHAAELNQQWIKDHLEENMKQGKDFLGRELDYFGKPYRFWCETKDWPTYLKEHKDAYKHLLKQDDNGKILGESEKTP